jgi:hypothetical protein
MQQMRGQVHTTGAAAAAAAVTQLPQVQSKGTRLVQPSQHDMLVCSTRDLPQ